MAEKGHLSWLGFLRFAGWAPQRVDENRQRREDGGAGSLPPHTETMVCFCHFSLVVDRKVKYGNSAGKVTLKLLQTQLKL